MSQNRNEEALKLLDDAIAMAIGEREIRWALAYCRQATYIAKLLKDFSKEKHYCDICLAHDPEDSWALTGLADVARRQGEIELAEEYTVRCTKALHKRVGPARIIGPSKTRDRARAKEPALSPADVPLKLSLSVSRANDGFIARLWHKLTRSKRQVNRQTRSARRRLGYWAPTKSPFRFCR